MKKKIGIILIIIFTIAIFIRAQLKFNPQVRLLASVINFSESTLKSSEYLAYNIDLKDLFTNYANSDIRYSGTASIKRIEGFPYSINGSIKGKRSLSQKKFSCNANLDVLVLEIGELDLYAKEDTVYLVAPILGGLSYGFDTGDNLFLETPNLNNDINREWFHNNKRNIYEFIQNITIEKTENTFVDEDETVAEEFKITIPEGQGGFIWELLGMNAPDHDIICSVFLDKYNHTRKLVFDLSYKTEGAYISIYGNNLSTLEMYAPLPDNEEVRATIKRDGDTIYTNSFSDSLSYYASNGDVYTLNCGMLLNYVEEGIKMEVSKIVVAKNKQTLAEGYVKGKISTDKNMGDVFENVDLSDVTIIDWDTIKNDTASFVDDVMSQARTNVDLFNLLD